MALLIVSCTAQDHEDNGDISEIRGVWLTNVDSDVLLSRTAIAEALQFIKEHHFNVVFPVVWNNALTTYPSALMDSLFGTPIDPRYTGRDPLAEVVEEAHRRGLLVIPWFEFGFSASYKKNGGTILTKKPHWAARDAKGNLLSKNGFEWMNAYHPQVQRFIMQLVLEVVQTYDVNGVQGDDRLPAQPVEGGYSAYTDSLYRAHHQGRPPPKDHRDPGWIRWRADILNRFAAELYTNIKTNKPHLIVSWAPSVYPWSYQEYLQDWPEWIRGGYADLVIPQVYRYEPAKYRSTMEEMKAVTPKTAKKFIGVYPGILMRLGNYYIDEAYLLQAVAYNRAHGYGGEVFFFYEGLRGKDNHLARVLINGPYRMVATFPRN
ncbi:family 10 glycosylhydrolase [candidate division KSB1 bacterium]|nr:family 10 glycosylhydrolase [candidate division KSB1 bacterium]